MAKIKLGVLREGKVPPDKRVPLTPKQCKLVTEKYPNVTVVVQPSPIRSFKDQDYLDEGVSLQEDLSDCDILMGVKEVNVEDLIPNKKFLFFSHTFKKQSYNRGLLKAVLDKKIQLIDYEVLKDKTNKRIIGFGRYAGIVGCYNGFRTYGLKHGLYTLKPANLCADRKEVEQELQKVVLPKDAKIVLTGFGRVGHGAREILDLLPINEVSPEEFLNKTFDKPVFTQLEVNDYNMKKNNQPFEKKEFYSNPENFKSNFSRFTKVASMYIPCHYWSSKSPFILTKEDLLSEDCKISVVADISCDIDTAIACTIRPSTIKDPIYGYDPKSGKEVDFMKEGAIAVMAVDNLPCELPLDASIDFGSELIKNILPALLEEDVDGVIARGSETNLNGQLTEGFEYLTAYLEGKE